MSRRIEIEEEKLILTDEIETVYEAEVKSHGNSARAHVPKKFIGRRALVIVLKD
ncbi:transposase [candidate division MSBL1 archaeon SCGC-AAA259I14]|uniref:Transposase n=1 Tax=candidate division MSBL1 archaeon SCGC-AAA259I14 TaxID=1698268 RepID=A0A133UUK1_9EURY|nr:transposase [candidate division MSBL1 archaeon SCGC-AAA259I14]